MFTLHFPPEEAMDMFEWCTSLSCSQNSSWVCNRYKSLFSIARLEQLKANYKKYEIQINVVYELAKVSYEIGV